MRHERMRLSWLVTENGIKTNNYRMNKEMNDIGEEFTNQHFLQETKFNDFAQSIDRFDDDKFLTVTQTL